MVVLTIRRVGLIYRPHLLAITLSLVIALGLLLQILDLPSSLLAIPSLSFIRSAFGDHGQEIVLSLNNSSFAPTSPDGVNKIKIVVNYATQDPMTVHDLVKGVMKVYSSNGTLLKTSSSPTPFPVSASGKLQLTTTLAENIIENITANIVFTNPIRTEIVSNELPVKLDLFRGITSSSLDEKQDTAEVVQEAQQPAVIPPVPAETEQITKQLPPQEIAPEEEEESIASIEPMEPLFQGAPASTSEPTTSSAREICTDGIDNDADTLADFEDSNCPMIRSPLKPLQQEELSSATLEICDDILDNDLDGKIDVEDEECLSTTPLNKQLAPEVQDGQDSQDSREEEQQSEGDDEDNANNDEDNEDEDEDNDNDD
jgi:hypothetical protein